MTTRVTERDPLTQPAENDKLLIVDTSDLVASADGTDKHITLANLLNLGPVTHYNDDTITKALGQWVGEFDDVIKTLVQNTVIATTTKPGISLRASNQQAKDQTDPNRTLSPANLAALQATETLMGLMAVASINELKEGVSDNKAVTPKGMFDALLGTSALGNNSQVFNIPFKNTAGNILMHLKVQFFEVESPTVYTSADPSNNYNHIHPYFDVTGTFPEPFPNTLLMVLPMGLDIEGEAIGSDFWCRHHDSTLSTTVVRCSRMNGTGGREPFEKVKVRLMAIGY